MRLLLALLTLMAFAQPASAAVRFHGSMARYMTRVAARAHVPLPTGTVRVTHRACPGFEGVSEGCWDGDRIWLPYRDAFAALHELGHIYDDRVLSRLDRRRVAHAMRTRRWMPERFASAYALCGVYRHLVIRTRNGMVSRSIVAYGWQPTERRHLRVCAAIVRTSWPHYMARRENPRARFGGLAAFSGR